MHSMFGGNAYSVALIQRFSFTCFSFFCVCNATFSILVTSTNLSNQAPLFTELRLLQGTLVDWLNWSCIFFVSHYRTIDGSLKLKPYLTISCNMTVNNAQGECTAAGFVETWWTQKVNLTVALTLS